MDTPSPLEAIFFAALDKGSAEERTAYLDAACAGDPDCRRRVEKMLAAQALADSFLESPLAAQGPTIDLPPAERPGTVVGPYKLLEVIGEGGFGTVFLAEQTAPVRRKVALKVLKAGMDTAQVVARFEAERQALAIMDHPNIAKVFDGGQTPGGRPYFVMELVRGVPITDYCDQAHLPPRQRLELFVPVCQAVQHAHQKGIIHRDLKPSNVLVGAHDGRPAAKVIDFGIAKATGHQLTDKTLFTGFAQLVGTPLYMSPEQAAQSPDIDTRSDVYSLGVLLYELLTGSTPFDKERFKRAAYDEIRRILREEEPPRPSTRLSESKDSLPSISAQRHTEPAKLTRLVRGELDWIVMTALEKDRTRRYETATGLAADVQRYLADEPVQACPPSAAYRVRKFARRNRRALAMAAVVTVTLLSAVGAASAALAWAARDRAARQAATDSEVDRALREAGRLRRAGRYAEAHAAVALANSLLAGGGRPETREQVRVVRADLDTVARLEEVRLRHWETRVHDFAHQDPEPAYAAAFRVHGLGPDDPDPAAAAEAVRASPIRDELVSALDDWAWARARSDPAGRDRLLAVARRADPDEWRNRLRDPAVHRDRAALEGLAGRPEVKAAAAATVVLLGRMLADAGARRLASDLLAGARLRHPDDFWLNYELSRHLIQQGLSPPTVAEALGYARAALALRPNSGRLHSVVANRLWSLGRVDEGIAAHRWALELAPDDAVIHYSLGRALVTKGAWDEAIAAYREAARLDPEALVVRRALAAAYHDAGQWDPAVAAYREVLRRQPADYDALVRLAWELANHPDPARRDAGEALAVARKAVRVRPDVGFGWNALGTACYRAGDWAGAVESLEKGRGYFKGGCAYEWFFLAMAHRRLGRGDVAQVWYDRAVRWVADNEKGLAGHRLMTDELSRFRAEAAEVLGVPAGGGTPPGKP